MRRIQGARLPLLLTGTATLAAALSIGFAGCDQGSAADSVGVGEGCVSTEQYFAENVWAKYMSNDCLQCHSASGAASTTSFILHAPAEAGYLDANLAVVKTIAQTQQNGQSLLLLKPTAQIAHQGGTRFKVGSDEYNAFKTLIDKIGATDDCPTNSAQFFGGVALMSPLDTLRKAALVLAARLPTDAEVAKVTAGGFGALDPILDQMMTEEAFYTRLRESYNDRFFTDFYMDRNNNPLDLISPDDDNPSTKYYQPDWFDAIAHDNMDGSYTADQADIEKYGALDAGDLHDKLEGWTRQAVAQEPLEIIDHVVRQNKPFSEVLTASYTVVNPFSAKAYSIKNATFKNAADPYEFVEAQVADGAAFPSAGVLTTPVWLNRHPTTATNRNRHRSRMVFQDWLGTDILKVAERPLDPTLVTSHNPTLFDPSCSVCHAQVDPIAGAFQNFQHEDGNQAAYVGDFAWYSDMRPPGIGTNSIPAEQFPNSLGWLGGTIAQDPRFSVSVTYQAFRMVTGQEPTPAPDDTTSKTFSTDFEAYLGQYYTIASIADKFKASNFNYKQLVKGIVMSPYFRAQNTADNINPDQLKKFSPLGTAHLITPEALNRKITNLLGMSWTTGDPRDFLLHDTDQYQLLYGGIDSINVTSRITAPNGIMVNVATRMGNEMACKFVPSEFAIDKSERRMFTLVDPTIEPKDVNGYEVADAKAAIITQIQKMHKQLLGEDLAADDPEIQRSYQLFLDTWQEGVDGIASQTVGEQLPYSCAPSVDYTNNTPLPSGDSAPDYSNDKYFTIRAWMTVTSYMMTDYKFLYE